MQVVTIRCGSTAKVVPVLLCYCLALLCGAAHSKASDDLFWKGMTEPTRRAVVGVQQQRWIYLYCMPCSSGYIECSSSPVFVVGACPVTQSGLSRQRENGKIGLEERRDHSGRRKEQRQRRSMKVIRGEQEALQRL